MNMDKYKKVPVKALNFVDQGHTEYKLYKGNDSEGENAKTKASILGYSGGIIKDHWWWDDLVIDISGISFKKKTYPVLQDHDTDKRLGITKKPNTDNNQLMFPDVDLLSNDLVDKFVQDSDQGFPFEASIYAVPTSIERVNEDEVVEVNGFSFKGPGTVWRKCQFKEVSVCVFGWDSNTNSEAFKEGDIDLSSSFISKTTTSSEEEMSIDKFKKDDPEGYTQLCNDIAAQFTKQIEEKDAEINTLKDTNNKLSASAKTTETRLVDLEKKFAIQNEKAIHDSAQYIFKNKFQDSGLPERLFSKIFGTIDYNSFVSNDNLDVEKFSEKVDAELKDWTDSIGGGGGTVMGLGMQTKDTNTSRDKNAMSDADIQDLVKKDLMSLNMLDDSFKS